MNSTMKINRCPFPERRAIYHRLAENYPERYYDPAKALGYGEELETILGDCCFAFHYAQGEDASSAKLSVLG